MARRKTVPAPPLRSASLESLGPLELSPAEVAAVGIVRAAADAVRALPLHGASWEAARATRQESPLAQHVAAAASLVRRTAESHARAALAPAKAPF
ncbi:hypothetical protein J2790_001175 [Paenarthrobacter nicotinovorans]|uniref:hypothetical protein n=1 Tax=Micrococcaceae TaxID=1268 RepID=UPI0008768CEC|nr:MULTISPECIES: hypothetical protein [Micrococcaceae]MDR6436054.1 hypothetical protein [Paenarthrobacter nicotinovorans]SCZ51480.1 hypothetical protein SAMN02799638_00921 [Arthrobacter sp. UNCCL28]